MDKAEFSNMSQGTDMGRVLMEADRCLLCHDAPCSKACPAGTDPGLFIRKLRLRNITGAIRTVKTNNILGGVCAVLCPVSQLCENKCLASGIDKPLKIGEIQRFLVQHGRQIGFDPFEKPVQRKEKIAVIGSGPAGLSCAAGLAQKGFKVTIFEAKPKEGGALRYMIPAYRLSGSFLDEEIKDIRALGVEIKCLQRIEGKEGVEDLFNQGFSAVFIGTGLWGAKQVIIQDNKNYEGLYSFNDYLTALRDGRFEEIKKKTEGKTVAVIGGGSTAADCAQAAAKLGAADVYMIYRRSYCQMPAWENEKTETLNASVHLLLLNTPVGLETDETDKITGLKLKRTRLSSQDETGRRQPEEIEGSQWTLDTDIVIEAAGAAAEKDSWSLYPSVKGDKIFSGGDIVRGASLVVYAVADGKAAAYKIEKMLT